MRLSSFLCLPLLSSPSMSPPAHFAFICSPLQGVVSEMPGQQNTVRFHSTFLTLSYLIPNPFFQIAVKSISYSTLIRIGILWGLGPGGYEKGKFGDAWGCHSPQYIKNMHNTLVQKLTGSDDDTRSIFAPFDALSLLIGDKNARSFCQRNIGISARPPLNNPSSSHSN